MLRIVLSTFMFVPFLVNSQVDSTLDSFWVKGIPWPKVLQIAKDQNKFIFLDFYATWCRPCRLMDKEVYSNGQVIKFMRQNFISVRVQVDSTKEDPEDVREWYRTAKALEHEFKITSLPTLLFLSPSGSLVHKAVGGQDVNQMLLRAKEAMDTSLQYYARLQKYTTNSLALKELPALANSARSFGDSAIASNIARQYAQEYVDRLPNSMLYDSGVVSFVASFPEVLEQKSRLISLCLLDPRRIDSLIFSGFSKSLVNYIIRRDFIAPAISSANVQKTQPDWHNAFKLINSTFGKAYASDMILEAKVEFYKMSRDWSRYTNALIDYVGTSYKTINSPAQALEVNNYAWEIFLYSNEKQQLNAAYNWVSHSLTIARADSLLTGYCLDTKANLIYKLGKTAEAIVIEEQALLMAPKEDAIRANLARMRKKEPTWLILRNNGSL